MQASVILWLTVAVYCRNSRYLSKWVVGVVVEVNDGNSGKIMVAAVIFAGVFAGIGIWSAMEGGESSAVTISALLALTFFAFAYRLFCLRRKVRASAASWPHWTNPALEPERAIVFVIALLAILFVVVNMITGDDNPPIPAALDTLIAGILIATPLLQIFVTKASAWRELLTDLDA